MGIPDSLAVPARVRLSRGAEADVVVKSRKLSFWDWAVELLAERAPEGGFTQARIVQMGVAIAAREGAYVPATAEAAQCKVRSSKGNCG